MSVRLLTFLLKNFNPVILDFIVELNLYFEIFYFKIIHFIKIFLKLRLIIIIISKGMTKIREKIKKKANKNYERKLSYKYA